MNQILVTEKLYVTPELKRKKKLYRLSFLVSVFIIIALASVFAYTEYDKIQSEEISKDILSEMLTQNIISEPEQIEQDKVWKIIISTIEDYNQQIDENNVTQPEVEEEAEKATAFITVKGKEYETVGTVKIPKINVNYPILAETSVALLKISPCKFYGPAPNEVGNLCIAGHNWKNNQFFSNVPKLVVGDVIEITDLNGKTKKYSVYDKYEVIPEDTSCTNQNTGGKRIVTLITCTNDNKRRVIVHAKEIE